MGPVSDTIEQRLAQTCVWDHLRPFGKRQVGGQNHSGFFGPLGDHLKQEFGADFRQRHISDFVDRDQVIAAPPRQYAPQLQLLLRLNQFVDQSGCSGETDPAFLPAGRHAEPGQKVRFPCAAFTDE